MVAEESGKWVKHEAELRPRLVRFRPRVWRARNMAMQLVPGIIQGRVGSFRYPVKAHGGRDRNTSVAAVNYVPVPA